VSPASRGKGIEDKARASENGQAPPRAEAQREARRKKLKRRAGCIWGLLAEPVALVVVSILAVIFGRAYLVRRARRLRRQAREARRAEDDETA